MFTSKLSESSALINQINRGDIYVVQIYIHCSKNGVDLSKQL